MTDFSWDKLAQNLTKDALSDGKKNYETDTRFYKLARNENDTGGALIRFLPDAEGVPFVKMTKINAHGGKGKRFCADWSPTSIGKPDPFNEMFSKLWNEGKKEEAKKYGRSIRYIANIKVIKDPANPANEGKIMLLDMSQTIFEKVKNAVQPSADEVALGTEPMQVFNPIEGNNFLYKVKRGSNSFITYEDSKFDEKVTSIYKDAAEYEADIKANGHILNDFLKPEFFKSYEELKDTMEWFNGTKDEKKTAGEFEAGKKDADEAFGAPTPTPEPVEAPKAEPTPEPKASEDDDLDALLDDLA